MRGAEKEAITFGRYSLRDVQDVVEFAQLHGVRVIPEFDMQGPRASYTTVQPAGWKGSIGRGEGSPISRVAHHAYG